MFSMGRESNHSFLSGTEVKTCGVLHLLPYTPHDLELSRRYNFTVVFDLAAVTGGRLFVSLYKLSQQSGCPVFVCTTIRNLLDRIFSSTIVVAAGGDVG